MSLPRPRPRMIVWGLATVYLMAAALTAQTLWPGNTVSVTVYKVHLMALGGWGGYWLDRALFPYDRPHTHLEVTSTVFGMSMMRRAIIVAACLVCVGLGA